MKIKSSYEFALAAPTSMGVRLTPEGRGAVQVSDRFCLQATSAETNVMNVAASLGLPCAALTRFVKGSPVAEFIKRSLRARGISSLGSEVEQGGPWGYRHQFNIADAGCGLRAPRVWNDRTGELGQTLQAEDYEPEALFGSRGVGILHISGLIAALSEGTGKACLELARTARKHGTLVSFDLNYRASFWQGREEELKETFQAIASQADILTSIDVIEGRPEDFAPMPLEEKGQRFRAIIERAREKYPQAQAFLMSLRETISAQEHRLGALLGRRVPLRSSLPVPCLFLTVSAGEMPWWGAISTASWGALKGPRHWSLAGPAPSWPRKATRTMQSLPMSSRSGIFTGVTPWCRDRGRILWQALSTMILCCTTKRAGNYTTVWPRTCLL